MGYIKRTPLADFHAQSRGGVGAKGSDTRDEDFVEYIYSASMHATLLFFTEQGRCYWLRVFEIPEGARNSKGRAIQNLLNLDADNRVNAVLRVKDLTTDEEFVNTHYLTFFTKSGLVRKSRLKDFSRPRQSGIIAIKLRDDDKVVSVMLSNGKCDFVLGSRKGRAVRFSESVLRPLGRSSMGVRGMRLEEDGDELVGAVCIKKPEEETILVISENGYGKRSSLEDYPLRNRGGKGVITLKITEKTGELVSIHSVTDAHDIMIINKSGVAIRTSMKDISVIGRNTQGVKLINLSKRGDEIASTCRVLSEEEQQPEVEERDEGIYEADGADIDDSEFSDDHADHDSDQE